MDSGNCKNFQRSSSCSINQHDKKQSSYLLKRYGQVTERKSAWIGTLLDNQKLAWNSKSVETTTNTGAY